MYLGHIGAAVHGYSAPLKECKENSVLMSQPTSARGAKLSCCTGYCGPIRELYSVM